MKGKALRLDSITQTGQVGSNQFPGPSPVGSPRLTGERQDFVEGLLERRHAGSQLKQRRPASTPAWPPWAATPRAPVLPSRYQT
jgi:hypothetical protein